MDTKESKSIAAMVVVGGLLNSASVATMTPSPSPFPSYTPLSPSYTPLSSSLGSNEIASTRSPFPERRRFSREISTTPIPTRTPKPTVALSANEEATADKIFETFHGEGWIKDIKDWCMAKADNRYTKGARNWLGGRLRIAKRVKEKLEEEWKRNAPPPTPTPVPLRQFQEDAMFQGAIKFDLVCRAETSLVLSIRETKDKIRRLCNGQGYSVSDRTIDRLAWNLHEEMENIRGFYRNEFPGWIETDHDYIEVRRNDLIKGELRSDFEPIDILPENDDEAAAVANAISIFHNPIIRLNETARRLGLPPDEVGRALPLHDWVVKNVKGYKKIEAPCKMKVDGEQRELFFGDLVHQSWWDWATSWNRS